MEREDRGGNNLEIARASESWVRRQYIKYILPLGIVFALGIAASATAGEAYSIVKWEDIAADVAKNELLVNLNSIGKERAAWPEAADAGLIGTAVNFSVAALFLELHRRALKKPLGKNPPAE